MVCTFTIIIRFSILICNDVECLSNEFICFSIIGAVLIVCGLYMVLWGKSKEMKKNNQLVPPHNTHEDEFDRVEVIVRDEVEDKSNQKERDKNGEKVSGDYHEDRKLELNSQSNQERDDENSNNTVFCT